MRNNPPSRSAAAADDGRRRRVRPTVVVVVNGRFQRSRMSAAPRIRCEACGAPREKPAPYCSNCGMRMREVHTRNIARRRWRRASSAPVREDVEDEVRKTLYGQRSSRVKLRGGG